jgi:hypothetical protein
MTELKNRISRSAMGVLLAVSAGLAGSVTTSAATAPRYDGLWSVSIVTEKGDCDRGYRYPIRIANGVLENAGSVGFTIGGKVTRSGAVTVTVSHGNSSAIGSGRLAGDSGAGYWQGGSCSGTWSAERRGES